jgi:hypothetical protein
MKQTLTDRQHRLAQAVQAHAVENYETGGWDILVECYTLQEVAELVGRARTEAGAIKSAAKAMSLLAEARSERQAQYRDEAPAVQAQPAKPEGFKVEGVAYGVDHHSGSYFVRFPGFVGKVYVDESGETYTPGWGGQRISSPNLCDHDASVPF